MTTTLLRLSSKRVHFLADTEQDGPHTRSEAEYMIGQSKPRYPVPAPLQYSTWIKSPTNGRWYEFVLDMETRTLLTFN